MQLNIVQEKEYRQAERKGRIRAEQQLKVSQVSTNIDTAGGPQLKSDIHWPMRPIGVITSVFMQRLGFHMCSGSNVASLVHCHKMILSITCLGLQERNAKATASSACGKESAGPARSCPLNYPGWPGAVHPLLGDLCVPPEHRYEA